MEESCSSLRPEVENLRMRIFRINSDVAEAKNELMEESRQIRLAGISSEGELDFRAVLAEYEESLENSLNQKRSHSEEWICKFREIFDEERRRNESEIEEQISWVRNRKSEMMVRVFSYCA
jgi:hypothetical protein